MHEVVAERERRLNSSTSYLSRLMSRAVDDLVRNMGTPATENYLVNIDGSVYVRHSSVEQLTESIRHNLSRHAQWFDSDEDINSADHAHRWVLDYATQGEAHRLYHYSCADCGRQIQASAMGG